MTELERALSDELEAARAYWLAEVERLTTALEQARRLLARSRTVGQPAERLTAEAEEVIIRALKGAPRSAKLTEKGKGS